MQEKQLNLLEANAKDLAQIARLAEEIWNQHYVSIIGQEQVDYMLNLIYSADSLRQQLMEKKHRFFLVYLNEKPVGFVSVNEESHGSWFLNKFYIQQNNAGKGIGTETLKEIEHLLKPKKITLTVNRQNYKSINFYFKNGFTINRVADFDIGGGYVMNDFVMEKKVSDF